MALTFPKPPAAAAPIPVSDQDTGMNIRKTGRKP